MGLSDEIYNDILKYTDKVKSDCDTIAKDVQKQMLSQIPSETPVGEYGINDKRRRQEHMKDGWIKGTIKLRDQRGTLYGVRNKTKPSVVHLVNFPHRITAIEYQGSASSPLLYRADKGMTKGDPFVVRVQDKGVEELDRRLNEYFGNREQ